MHKNLKAGHLPVLHEKQMKTIVRIILVLLLVSCSRGRCKDRIYAIAESPVIADDLSNKMVNTIAEDSQGHIWFGTFRGLNKYDVHEFHQYFCTDDSLDLPDNQIKDIMLDSKGRLWIATVNGMCLYTDKDNFHRIHINNSNRNCIQILENHSGKIYLNLIHQLMVYNQESDEFEMVNPNFDPQHLFNTRCFIAPDNKLWAATPFSLRRYNSDTAALEDSIPLNGFPRYFFMEKSGMLWMCGNEGIQLYDMVEKRFAEVSRSVSHHPMLSQSPVSLIHPYNDDCLLLNTDIHGLFVYNTKEETVIHQGESGFPFDAPDFKISTMFTDSRKNLWIGSEDQGYTVRYNYKEKFNTDNYLVSQLKNISVVSVTSDANDNLWITTLLDGLFIYNRQSKKMRHLLPQELLGKNYRHKKSASYIMIDGDDIWLTAPNIGKVLRCSYHGEIFRIEKSFDIFLPMSIAKDSHGTIWVSTAVAVVKALRKGENNFETIDAFPNKTTFIPSILPVKEGKMLAAAFYNPLRFIDEKTWEITEPPFGGEMLAAAIRRSVFIPTAVKQDSRGDLWIGTVSNGLLRYCSGNDSIEHIAGTPCLDISGIEEDRQGNIWVSTQYGLGLYERSSGEFINYYEADGIGGNQFYDRASCSLDDGTLVFGGTHGLTMFNPLDVSQKRTIPLLFEDLKIHNVAARPQDGKNIDRHLSYSPDIRLEHYENGFSISFAALDYSEHERVHYYYMMEGFDKYWIDARNNREVYYANLPAGSYTFRVKVTNNNRSIAETENSIRVIIRPAPWMSWWAWLFYTVIAIVVIGFIVRLRHRISQEKEAARRSELEKEQEQRVNKMNMSFFANVSHEFRTPLTMIAGPVTQLCESPDIKGDNKNLLHVVQRSVGRMLRLVNQLMDFNKLENDTLKLHVKRTDIISQLQSFIDIFRINANEKGITLNTSGLEDTFLMWLDVDKLDKIISNLLSNALKFTSSNGNVSISFDVISNEDVRGIIGSEQVKNQSQYVKITVTDSGNGIPENQLEKIFERYYQLDNQSQATLNWGTGIGLYYSRSLARLHHGFLFASNRTDAKGAVFTLLLPVDDSAYTENEKRSAEETQTTAYPLELSYSATDDTADKDTEKPTILVVDDDTEVVHYLKALLSPFYKVICRFDADSAMRVLSESTPDFILSDVVMPGRDGLELCQMIKSDPQLCHIPVILVTAKSTVDNQVEGLNSGAVAYVTKPFDPNYLLALLKSILTNRNRVRDLLSRATQIETIEENVLSPQDNAFMTELYSLMENELSNPELDVAHMTQLMKISRTKFYYKVKGLTGENPSAFFKTYKLNRAAELLKTGKYTISEVADMTGFNTLSHFSTSFKKQFGTTPSEYGK